MSVSTAVLPAIETPVRENIRENSIGKSMKKACNHCGYRLFLWSECRDLNPGPLGPEPSAIPSFATPRKGTNLL